MFSKAFLRGLAILALAGCLAAPAAADMKAFNAAVKAGDARTAAAEAKATWPAFDKASPDTATVAREFGFWSYTAGDYAAARDFALYLKTNAASLPKPDDQPNTTNILFAVSSFRLDMNDARRCSMR